MINSASQYPFYGPEIKCPHCRQIIPALTLTDSYLCTRHGAFEVSLDTHDLVHVQSGRHWRQWDGEWYRQHTHPDGIRFEIHEALDRLYTEGYRATRVIIAERYRSLVKSYLEYSTPWRGQTDSTSPRLYGLPVTFSPSSNDVPQWEVINFDLEKEPGVPNNYRYLKFFE
ncbi:MAG: TIGR02652 family protein [Cyanobacteria bacterium P01_D01_bin.156]